MPKKGDKMGADGLFYQGAPAVGGGGGAAGGEGVKVMDFEAVLDQCYRHKGPESACRSLKACSFPCTERLAGLAGNGFSFLI